MHGKGQFAAVPLNLLGDNVVGCDVGDIGYWSQRATSEASKYAASVHAPLVVQDDDLRIPPLSEWTVRPDAVSAVVLVPAA